MIGKLHHFGNVASIGKNLFCGYNVYNWVQKFLFFTVIVYITELENFSWCLVNIVLSDF